MKLQPSPPFLMPSSPSSCSPPFPLLSFPFTPPSLPSPFLALPLPLSFLWISSLLILIAYALPCLSFLLPPPHLPLQPSLYTLSLTHFHFSPLSYGQHSIIHLLLSKNNETPVFWILHWSR